MIGGTAGCLDFDDTYFIVSDVIPLLMVIMHVGNTYYNVGSIWSELMPLLMVVP